MHIMPGRYRQVQHVSTAQPRWWCSPGNAWLDRAHGQVLGAVVLEPRRSSIGHGRPSIEGLRWDLEAPRGVSFFRTIIHPPVRTHEILSCLFCGAVRRLPPTRRRHRPAMIYLLPFPLIGQPGALLFFMMRSVDHQTDDQSWYTSSNSVNIYAIAG